MIGPIAVRDRTLQREPERRYPSAGAMCAKIERLASASDPAAIGFVGVRL